ncbi:MAG: IPT/TIG domain-containing protein [Acidobacteria bacterium]|nr:IPT/TIG domain-containing protein [Acidobacteriota bacterium]
MRDRIIKTYLLSLAVFLTLLSVTSALAVQSTTIKKGADASAVQKATTSITLRKQRQQLYLEVRPSPERLELYAGNRKVTLIEGKNRTRFDITQFINEIPNGQLRVIARDRQGHTISKTLDISRYQDSVKKDSGPTSARTSSRVQSIKQQPPTGSASTSRTTVDRRANAVPGLSQNASTYLQKIEKANSLEDLQRAFKESNLSDKDMKQLADAIKDSRYLNKLNGIARRETSNRSAATQTKNKNTRASASGIRGTPTKAHTQRLEKIGREVENMKAALETKKAPGRTSYPDSGRTATQLPAPSSPAWSIASVSPSSVRIGGNVTISGEGFGTTPGRVVIRFASSPSRRGEVMDCERIVSWSDNRIMATIPRAAADRVRDTDKRVVVWVKVAGGEVGPWHEITLLPDLSLLPPEITIMSHTLVTPDQPFLIQGKNFLSARRGTVVLQFAGKEFPAVVRSWHDEAIEIQVPSIIRLMEAPGWLVVRNHAGYEATAPVTFNPAIWRNDIFGPGDGYRDIIIKVSCSPWLGPTEDGDNPAWLLCLFGQKKQQRVNFGLLNGWKVVSGRTELFDGSGWQDRPDCGAYYESGPVRNSSSVETMRVTWTNAFSKCQFRDFYTIEGPAGIPPDATYDPTGACIDNRNEPHSPVDCDW